jgi:hypothetical protein
MINEKTTRQDNWLQAYARNNTSQYGEDGIIEKVLEIIDRKSVV